MNKAQLGKWTYDILAIIEMGLKEGQDCQFKTPGYNVFR